MVSPLMGLIMVVTLKLAQAHSDCEWTNELETTDIQLFIEQIKTPSAMEMPRYSEFKSFEFKGDVIFSLLKHFLLFQFVMHENN